MYNMPCPVCSNCSIPLVPFVLVLSNHASPLSPFCNMFLPASSTHETLKTHPQNSAKMFKNRPPLYPPHVKTKNQSAQIFSRSLARSTRRVGNDSTKANCLDFLKKLLQNYTYIDRNEPNIRTNQQPYKRSHKNNQPTKQTNQPTNQQTDRQTNKQLTNYPTTQVPNYLPN